MKKVLLLALFATSALSYTANARRWEKLGERKVNFKSDRDNISGIGEGLFSALKLKVTGGSTTMAKMIVHFRNGESHEVGLKQNFADGNESRVINIPGRLRLIEKVVFWYEAVSATEGNKPVVELWADIDSFLSTLMLSQAFMISSFAAS